MRNKRILCVSALSLLMFACSSNQAPVSAANSLSSGANQVPANNMNNAVDNTPVNVTDNSMNNNSNSGTNSVYFGVNKYDIDSQYDSLITYNANYLASHHQAAVKIDGNTDDTGSVEYNLALGQRRADAVKRALIAKGASSSQIEATSNGKMMAKFSNSTDDGRSKNRRADVIYTKQAPAGYSLNQDGLPVTK